MQRAWPMLAAANLTGVGCGNGSAVPGAGKALQRAELDQIGEYYALASHLDPSRSSRARHLERAVRATGAVHRPGRGACARG